LSKQLWSLWVTPQGLSIKSTFAAYPQPIEANMINIAKLYVMSRYYHETVSDLARMAQGLFLRWTSFINNQSTQADLQNAASHLALFFTFFALYC